MRKLCKFIRSNIKVVVAFVIGLALAGTGVYAVTVIAGTSISYDNSNSGLSATDVQSAIDELYEKADIRKSPNIVSVYTYNASTCVTGEETTCVKSTCHKSTAANSCKAGDIVKYKVNDTDIVTFHVMYDNGSTMTMQSQKNTIDNTMWISAADYATYNTDGTSCSYDTCNDEGPMTALVALERATKSWTNVNNQTYTMGTTSLSSNGELTGCSAYNSCTINQYTLDGRTAKARMITVQEAVNLGCTTTNKSCPSWMNNYLYNSTSYGGTVNDSTLDLATGSNNNGYWTMNAHSANISKHDAWYVYFRGHVSSNRSYSSSYGARAVVVVSK